MNKIPTHKISEQFHGETVFLRYISEKEQAPVIDYAHRDDYYMFFFVEKGECKLLLDFEEYTITENSILCILPGQVHLFVNLINAGGWGLAADSMLVKDEYKKVFEKASLFRSETKLNSEAIGNLTHCSSAIHKRLKSERQHIEQSIVHDLLSYCIGTSAEAYQKDLPILESNRATTITFQFKSLLSANYQSLKRPSEYASKMNLSPVYLNEAVKKTTGLTVGDCIQNEIMTQAKRLLYYTDLSIKEIALKLGYEDWAYFTRLFTKVSELSPTQFRKKHLK